MKSELKALVFVALLAALAGTSARTETTNAWTNTGGGAWNSAGNWDPNTVPADSATRVVFTNNAGPYTVDFSGVAQATSGMTVVENDNVVFDLKGNQWLGYASDGNYAVRWGTAAGSTSTVTFSSSVAPGVGGNTADFSASWNTWINIGNYTGLTTVNINTNLGYGVTVLMPINMAFANLPSTNTVINIDGPGSVLQATYVNQSYVGGIVNVSNGGLLEFDGFTYLRADGYPSFFTISNATFKTGYATLGNLQGNITTVNLYDNSDWSNDNYVQMGFNTGGAVILVDDSTLTANDLIVGGQWTYDNGLLTVRNGSTVTLSNSLVVHKQAFENTYSTNQVVLNGATIRLGSPAASGVLTNRGIMKAMGTITGMGAGPALVRNESSLEIGGSIGTLTLNNASLELAAGSETLFEFSDAAHDQIAGSGGLASVLGSNLFSLASGSAPLAPGYKWGLGAYDFIVNSNVTWNPQYDNLTNILAAAGLVQDFDYRYGVVNIGGGLQALRLEFVPEPSTALLLLGGGLVLWRSRRRG